MLRRVYVEYDPAVRRARMGCAALALVGTGMNAISPSMPERLLWTPVAAGIAVSLAVLSRRPAELSAPELSRPGVARNATLNGHE